MYMMREGETAIKRIMSQASAGVLEDNRVNCLKKVVDN